MRFYRNDAWFYIPILLLAVTLIIWLADLSKIITVFPLDYTNDMSSYIAQFDFLIKCGYNKFCPYWYNGFITFKLTAPGWYIFTLPIYWITGTVQSAFFASLVLIFGIGFVSIFLLGKLHRLSATKRIAFFLFFFANAIAIGNFIRLGRAHELFAWVNFVIISLIILYYKDKKINWKFCWTIIPASIILLTHQAVTILAMVTIFSLFLVKKRQDYLPIIVSFLITMVVTAFWWIPYLKAFGQTAGSDLILTETLLRFDSAYLAQSLTAFIIPIALWITFYFYWKSSNRKRNELIFFFPILLLSFLLFTRLICFIPIFKYVYPDVYMLYFIFFAIFAFLKTDFSKFSKRIKQVAAIAVLFFAIASMTVNFIHTPKFIVPGEFEKEVVSTLQYVDGKFLLLGQMPTTRLYSNALYSYASVHHNLSTPGGWYTALAKPEYYKTLFDVREHLENKDCENLIKTTIFLNALYIISADENCNTLKLCGLNSKYQSPKYEGHKACVYKLEGNNYA